jgi:hypothetical protein
LHADKQTNRHAGQQDTIGTPDIFFDHSLLERKRGRERRE